MRRYISTGKILFFGYFLFHFLLGTLLLSRPFAWKGDNPLPLIDSFFTAVSAVCVTGLATVNTVDFSVAGQWTILYLIQAGGLGFITFSTMYLLFPGAKISMGNRKIIREYYVESLGVRPRSIVRTILLFTFIIEATGALLLGLLFKQRDVAQPWFNGIFHGVSAFCNAGFSRFPDSMMSFQDQWSVNLVLSMLIILGGLGFMTIWDCLRRLWNPKERLHFHSKVMLSGTAVLLLAGGILYFLLEYNYSLKGMVWHEKILAAGFQSVTTRTAGFNSIDQSQLSFGGWTLTLLLMIIGGGSGSTAGGLKVTTAVLLFLVLIRKMNRRGESRMFHRRISRDSLSRATFFFLKALAILFIVILLLSQTEAGNPNVSTTALIYEAFSALGTVGLSQGITGQLSNLGKWIIIFTMFAGRIGLFALIMPEYDREDERHVDFPKGEVLIG